MSGPDSIAGGFRGPIIKGAVLGTKCGEEVGSVLCVALSGPLDAPYGDGWVDTIHSVSLGMANPSVTCNSLSTSLSLV